MRKLAPELPSDAARKSATVYIFKTAETTRSTPTQSLRLPIPFGRKIDQEVLQHPPKASFSPTQKATGTFDPLKSNATDAQDIYWAGPTSPLKERITKSDDAIPSFLTRVENIECKQPTPLFAGSALEAVLASISAARTTMLKARQRTLALYNHHNDVLFSGAGIVVGIAILGTDLGSNVGRATEQQAPAATQVALTAISEWKSPPTNRPRLEATHVEPAAIGSLGAAVVEHPPASRISSKFDLQEVIKVSLPTENGPAQVAQLSSPDMTLQTTASADIAKLQASAEHPEVVTTIEVPDESSLANSGGALVPENQTAKLASQEDSAVVQKIAKKSATFRKAIARPDEAVAHRTRSAMRIKEAAAPVQRKAASVAMRARHAISGLGANSTIVAKKKLAHVAKPVSLSPDNTPFIAVRTLDEAMALQYGAK